MQQGSKSFADLIVIYILNIVGSYKTSESHTVQQAFI